MEELNKVITKLESSTTDRDKLLALKELEKLAKSYQYDLIHNEQGEDYLSLANNKFKRVILKKLIEMGYARDGELYLLKVGGDRDSVSVADDDKVLIRFGYNKDVFYKHTLSVSKLYKINDKASSALKKSLGFTELSKVVSLTRLEYIKAIDLIDNTSLAKGFILECLEGNK